MAVIWLIVLGAIGSVVAAFLLLPVVLAVAGSRPGVNGDLDLLAEVAPWWGLLGLRARRREPAWELVPVLAGHALGPTFRVGQPKADSPSVGRQERGVERPVEEVDQEAGPGPWDRLLRVGPKVRALTPSVVRMARTLPWVIGLRRVRLDGAVGLADPASTGQLCGLLHAIVPVVPRRVRLRVDPDFTGAGVRGRVDVRLHLYLARLLWILFRFAVAAGWVWARLRVHTWWATRHGRFRG